MVVVGRYTNTTFPSKIHILFGLGNNGGSWSLPAVLLWAWKNLQYVVCRETGLTFIMLLHYNVVELCLFCVW